MWQRAPHQRRAENAPLAAAALLPPMDNNLPPLLELSFNDDGAAVMAPVDPLAPLSPLSNLKRALRKSSRETLLLLPQGPCKASSEALDLLVAVNQDLLSMIIGRHSAFKYLSVESISDAAILVLPPSLWKDLSAHAQELPGPSQHFKTVVELALKSPLLPGWNHHSPHGGNFLAKVLQVFTLRLLAGAAAKAKPSTSLKRRHVIRAFKEDAGLRGLLVVLPAAAPDAQGGCAPDSPPPQEGEGF